MTLDLAFSPKMEDHLRRHAAATGQDVPSFVRGAVEEKLVALPVESPAPGEAKSSLSQQRVASFDAWVARLRVATNGKEELSSYAVDDRRESIYAGRGE